MKKCIFLLVSIMTFGVLLTSCGQTKECPAYSEVVTDANQPEVVLS